MKFHYKYSSQHFPFVLALLAVSLSFARSFWFEGRGISEETRSLVDIEAETQIECTVFFIDGTSIRGSTKVFEGEEEYGDDDDDDNDEYVCMATHPIYITYTVLGDIESFVGPSLVLSQTTFTFPSSMIGDDKVMDLNDDALRASISVSLPDQILQKQSQTSFSRPPYLEGTYKSLIIRVSDNTGDTPAETADDLYGVFFDDSDNYNGVSVNSVYSGCSDGKFGIIPATGSDVTNGVVEVTLDMVVAGLHHKEFRDDVLNLLPSGIDEDYTFTLMVYPKSVTFCSPGETCGTVGLGSKPGTNSWYRSGAVAKVMVGVHEMGHNLGQGHSGFEDKEYGDKSCPMGGESGGVSDGQKCFNAAKMYHLGWFAEYNRDVTLTKHSFGGTLVGVNDAVNKEISPDQYLVVRITDSGAAPLYLMYNRVEGVNKFLKNDLYRDKVVVVEQNTAAGQSLVKATLGQDEIYTQSDWAGTGSSLKIKICSIIDGVPDTASVDIWLDGINESTNCSGTSSPTASPAPTTQYKEIEDLGMCSLAFPLTKKCPECTGHCRDDDDCEDGLICFSRSSGYEDVPGCVWGDDSASLIEDNSNYCFKPNTEEGVVSYVKQCNTSGPCDRCQGNCFNNASCEGDLKCMRRDEYEEVPGCTGAGGVHDAIGKNICYAVPTPAPTVATPNPTAAPTASPAPTTVYKEVRFVGNPCTSAFPLTGKCKECTGDCDNDDDCEDGLICFSRNNGYGDVPGCTWGDDSASLINTGHDFCIKPNIEEGVISYVRQCNESSPCGRCQGNCFRHISCEGDLKCMTRDEYEEVPGCTGAGGIHDAIGKNICYSTSTPAPIVSTPAPIASTPAPIASTPNPTAATPVPTASTPNPTAATPDPAASPAPTTEYKEVQFVGNPCTSAFPLTGRCKECTGDCDSDDDCENGLICFSRSSGDEDVPGCTWGDDSASLISTGHDFCIKPNTEEGAISYVGECDTSSPCGRCQGDCDGNGGCEGDLKCMQRVGYEEVPGCTGAGGIYDAGGVDICYATPTPAPIASTPDPTAVTPAPIASTPAPISNPLPCADRTYQWKINSTGKKKNWCNWAKEHPNTGLACETKDIYDECPVTCERCPSITPAPIVSTRAPTPSQSCCDDMKSTVESIEVDMDNMNSRMNNMENQMEHLSNNVEEIMNILQMFTSAPVASTPAPVSSTPAPIICADRTYQWKINDIGRKKNWCDWAKEQANTGLACETKDIYDECPVTCGVCTP